MLCFSFKVVAKSMCRYTISVRVFFILLHAARMWIYFCSIYTFFSDFVQQTTTRESREGRIFHDRLFSVCFSLNISVETFCLRTQKNL